MVGALARFVGLSRHLLRCSAGTGLGGNALRGGEGLGSESVRK